MKLDRFATQTVPGATWFRRLWCGISGHNCELVKKEIERMDTVTPNGPSPTPEPGYILIERFNSLSEIVEIRTEFLRCTKCGGMFRQRFYKQAERPFSTWMELYVGDGRVIM